MYSGSRREMRTPFRLQCTPSETGSSLPMEPSSVRPSIQRPNWSAIARVLRLSARNPAYGGQEGALNPPNTVTYMKKCVSRQVTNLGKIVIGGARAIFTGSHCARHWIILRAGNWWRPMVPNRQPDLFQPDDPDQFVDQPPRAYTADPDEVRADLHKMLAEARAAKTLTWPPKTVSLYQTIFPQMSKWLPEDEAAQLRLEFEAELARLTAA
jgi:hypothetical protein